MFVADSRSEVECCAPFRCHTPDGVSESSRTSYSCCRPSRLLNSLKIVILTTKEQLTYTICILIKVFCYYVLWSLLFDFIDLLKKHLLNISQVIDIADCVIVLFHLFKCSIQHTTYVHAHKHIDIYHRYMFVLSAKYNKKAFE